MAIRITSKNEYELTNGRIRNLYRKSKDPNPKVLEIQEDKLTRFKKLQDDWIVLGGMSRIRYAFFENDPKPLALFMSYTIPEFQVVPAINLHYLTTPHIKLVLNAIKFINGSRFKQGLAPMVSWKMLDKMHIPYKSYRSYKINGIKPTEYIPVDRWKNVAMNEKSRWQGKFYD